LLTEKEKIVSDIFEQLSNTAGYGVTKETYQETRDRLTKKWGMQASWTDVTRAVHVQLSLRFAKEGNFQHLAWLESSMANFLWQNHADFRNSQLQSARYNLMLFKKAGAKSAWVDVSTSGCTACKSLDGKTFDITDALRNIPIPPKDCTCKPDENLARGYCTCLLYANF
jgi:hypothetical protein